MGTQDVVPSSDRATWLKGPPARCNVPPLRPDRAFHLLLLGAPGVGKGTQAELLCHRLRTCHLSTGDVFRTAKTLADHERSPAMTDALGYMKRGELVPDTTVLNLIRERTCCLRCPGGFLLDGFPRTVAQAEALHEILEEEGIRLNAVLDYRLPLDELVARCSGRRTCGHCKAVFHVASRPPKVAGVCDHCGSPLVQREDDRPESIRVRMDAYATQTAPLTDFYAKLNLLIPIPADGSPEDVFARTLELLPGVPA